MFNMKQLRITKNEELVGVLDFTNMVFKYNWDYSGETPIELYPENDINVEPSTDNILMFLSSALKIKKSALDIATAIAKTSRVKYSGFILTRI